MIFQIMDNNQNIDDDQEQSVKHSDFSIDHILNRAGNNIVKSSENPIYCERTMSDNVKKFEWLQCSRYCPPKVPRLHKKDVQKRQLGRHPRIPFTSHQLSILEQKFRDSPYLSSEEVIVLSKKLHLADIRVKIWFQNRRARERREKNGIFGENKVSEEKKGVPEDTLQRYGTAVPPDPSIRGSGIDSRRSKVPTCRNHGTTVPLDCSKSSGLIVNDASDIFKTSDVPYLWTNSTSGQNVSLFIPFVNFSHCSSKNVEL